MHVVPLKPAALGGEAINVGRHHVRCAVTAQLRPQIIHADEQDIGPPLVALVALVALVGECGGGEHGGAEYEGE